LVQNASDIIAIFEEDGTVRYMSPSVERVLGYRPEELVGTSAFNHIYPEEVELASRSFAEVLETGGVIPPVELRVRAADGSWRHMETILNNLLDDPDVGGIVANSRDITERKRAEEALRQSEERYRALTQNSSDIVTLLRADGTIRYHSPSVERILGYSTEEMVGDNVFNYVYPDDLGRVEMAFCEGLKDPRRRPSAEYRFRHKDGSWVWIESVGTNLLDDPQVGEYVVNSRDVTERKQAEEEKSRQARHAALRADVRATLAEGGTLQGILQRCTESMVGHLDAAFARIWTLNEEENVLELQASAGMYTRLDGAYSQIPVGKYKIGLIAQERQPYLINDILGDPRIHDKEWAKREGMVAFAGYPLVVEDRLVGVMAMFSRHPLREDTIEALASVADAIAQGIRRKRTEEALKESEERYRALMEQSVEAIYLYDAHTKRILESNAAFRRMMGFSEEQLLGMRIYDFIAHDKEDIDRHVLRSLKEKRRHIGERMYRCKDGSIIVVDTSASVISYDGKTALCAVSRDITERKRAERLRPHL
jgi:PAS domain S-box-containing protein